MKYLSGTCCRQKIKNLNNNRKETTNANITIKVFFYFNESAPRKFFIATHMVCLYSLKNFVFNSSLTTNIFYDINKVKVLMCISNTY